MDVKERQLEGGSVSPLAVKLWGIFVEAKFDESDYLCNCERQAKIVHNKLHGSDPPRCTNDD